MAKIEEKKDSKEYLNKLGKLDSLEALLNKKNYGTPIVVDINGAKTIPENIKRPEPEQKPKKKEEPPKAPPKPIVQKQDTVNIEARPLTEGTPGAIQRYNHDESMLGQGVRKNFNSLIDENFTVQDDIKKRSEESKKSASSSEAMAINAMLAELRRAEQSKTNYDQSRAYKQKLLRNMMADAGLEIDDSPTKSEFNAESFQKGIKTQLDSVNKSPEDVSTMEKIIAAFGPGILALAAGGEAGATAGVAAFKTSQEEYDKTRKARTEERKAKIEGLGKQIDGTGKLLAAEVDRQKLDFEKQKQRASFGMDKHKALFEAAKSLNSEDSTVMRESPKIIQDYMKWLHDNRQDASELSAKQFIDQQNTINKLNADGVNKWADIEDKQIGRTHELTKQDDSQAHDIDKIGKQSAADIAKANATAKLPGGGSRRPPTEGMTNSANAHASMKKADQAWGRMMQGKSQPPSMSSRWYDIQKSIFENASGNTAMGTLLKQIPDESMRRQIQIELDWLAPHLRKTSGAAINVGEYIAEGNRFFPRNGDGPETLAEKAASRQQQMENYRVGAGSAPIPQIMQPNLPPGKTMSREEKIKRLQQLEGKK